MRSGDTRVTSLPLTRTLRELARSSPESRLSSVDLPAPLGPMTAWISPRSNASETESTAASAPKRRDKADVSRSGSATRASQQAGEPARQEEHYRDHESADDRVPVRRHLLAVVLHEAEQERAQRRPVERALPAQEHRHQQQARLAPGKVRGVDESVERRVEVAGQPGQHASDHERDELVAARRVSERSHALLVVADAGEHVAEGSAQHAQEQEGGDDQRDPDREGGGGGPPGGEGGEGRAG